jgi:hypothetical protein
VKPEGTCDLIELNYSNDKIVFWEDGGSVEMDLPPGQYELIGKGDQINEEVAEKIVELDYFDGVGPMYANYGLKHVWTFGKTFHTGKASLASWIRSIGYSVDRCVILKIK